MKKNGVILVFSFLIAFEQKGSDSPLDKQSNFTVIINESTKQMGIVDPPILRINNEGKFFSNVVDEDIEKSIKEYLNSGPSYIIQLTLQVTDENKTSVKTLDVALAKLKELSDSKRKTIIYVYFNTLYSKQIKYGKLKK